VSSGIVERMVCLLASEHARVRSPALRTIGNIVTGDDRQTSAVLACAVTLPNLGRLLRDKKKSTRKEATWTLSNITGTYAKKLHQLTLQA
jgi:hypothetical protein